MKKKKIVLTLGVNAAATVSLLAASPSERYAYDASGNLVEKQIGERITQFEYTGNLLKGSLFDAAQKQYRYDDAGRLVEELEGEQVVRKLSYQFADKVTKVQNGNESAELFYNAEGQLIGKKSSDDIEIFAWDGLALVTRGEEYFANEDSFVGGVPAMIGDDVSVSDYNGTSLILGNVSFDGSAFGDGLEEGLFTGKPFIGELGSFVFNFRNYMVDASRWITVDPLGYPDGSNNAIMTKNDPVNYADPTGLSAECPAYRRHDVPITLSDPDVVITHDIEYGTNRAPRKVSGKNGGKMHVSGADAADLTSINFYLGANYVKGDSTACNSGGTKFKWKDGHFQATEAYPDGIDSKSSSGFIKYVKEQ